MNFPLPVGWKLLSLIECPGCGGWMHFHMGEGTKRRMYCPNSSCANTTHVYTVEIQVDGLTIIEVLQ